ncbi:MAG: CheW protein [Proteobacteria bacterium]|nr:CheW protein [Pseudomonadota bacterium]
MSAPQVAGQAAAAIMTGTAAQYLTFTLGQEEYAVDILKVQEIRGYDAVTAIANTPAFIKGVINLRGVIVPIVDLRLKFQMGETSYDAFTVVIILNVLDRVMGIVVDGVTDVLACPAEQIKPAPQFGAALDTRYIDGLATVDGRMIILVDIEKLMSSPEMALMDEALDGV